MSEKNPRKRNRSKTPRNPAGGDIPAADLPLPKHPASPATDTIEATKTHEQLQLENERLRLENERLQLENERLRPEIFERRADDHIHTAYAKAFGLIRGIALKNKAFESLEVRARPDLIVDRAVAFEAVLVTVSSAGRTRHEIVAADPARALLEALSRFDNTFVGGPIKALRSSSDLEALYAFIDNRWMDATKRFYPSGNLTKMLDEDQDGWIAKAGSLDKERKAT